jgi:hypothetical protein
MILKHIDESDFEEIELVYPDFQVELANKISQSINSKFPMITHREGKKIFLLGEDPDPSISRLDKEMGSGKYRITIEPLI